MWNIWPFNRKSKAAAEVKPAVKVAEPKKECCCSETAKPAAAKPAAAKPEPKAKVESKETK